jgi:hypothetical protein
MGPDRRAANRGLRGALFALAFVALFLKVLAPPGFMVEDGTRGGSFPIVICTAQGQVQLDAAHDGAPVHKSGSDSACPFAGNGVGAAPPLGALPAVAIPTAYRAIAAKSAPDLAPGRGLAAPPPPSQGPPTLL